MSVNIISRNVSKNLSILYKVKHKLKTDHLVTLYCSLILSYMRVACEIWGNTYHSSLNSLIMLQIKAIRTIARVPYREHTNPLFVK